MIEKYIGLLEISEQDLIASKILYDKELYPQSLFYLQQSAEKLTKYIGLTNNVITKNDLLKSIGHNSIKIYKKSMGNFKTMFPELVSIDIDKAFQEIKELADKKPINEVVNLSLIHI